MYEPFTVSKKGGLLSRFRCAYMDPEPAYMDQRVLANLTDVLTLRDV